MDTDNEVPDIEFPENPLDLLVFDVAPDEVPEEFSPKQLVVSDEERAYLENLRESFRQEWETGESTEGTPTEVVKSTREELVKVLPDAIGRIARILRHAPEDSNMAGNLAWKVISAVLDQKGTIKVDDPLAELVEEMRKAGSKKNEAVSD